MTKKSNYICSTCGRGYGRAWSARRHIKNVEFGNGFVVGEAEHRIGLATGTMPLPLPRSLQRSKREIPDIMDIANEEMIRGFYRKMGEYAFEQVIEADSKTAMLLAQLALLDKGIFKSSPDLERFFKSSIR